MKKFLLVAPLLVLISILTGCKSFWYQEGKTYEECRLDLHQCVAEMTKYSDKGYSLGAYDVRFERNCMKQMGYRLVKERRLPLTVRRQGPESFVGTYGVAGILDE